MAKVKIYDIRIFKEFLEITAVISTVLSLVLVFAEMPKDYKLQMGYGFIFLLFLIYIGLWLRSNFLQNINLDIEGSQVSIKTGSIFAQPGFKVIGFNEYFDTNVDDILISNHSLNGIFIKDHLNISPTLLDEHIKNYQFDNEEVLGEQTARKVGKKLKYKIGTICVYNEYILAAFSKFDDKNKAVLTMPEYLEFLINFWDRVNRVYAQKSVSVPIFGSGITRIKEHKNISDEELLKIMLWTFRISEMRFKHPAKLSIVIHDDKIDKINLLDIKSAKNGL